MKRRLYHILLILFLLLLYPLSRYNYLLFHTFVEAWAMIVATSIFLVAWNTRGFSDDDYLLFLGVGYLFVAILTFFHTIAFYGLNVFPGIGPNPATQFWILGRYLETFILITTPLLVGIQLRKKLLYGLFWGMGLFALLGALSILVIPIFPTCFEKGVGLTPFKITSEYIFIGLLTLSFLYLLKTNQDQRRWFFREYSFAIILTILAGLSFTLYADVYGFFNFLGHIFYLISFYIIYRIIFIRGLQQPTNLLFHKLNEARENVEFVNRCLLSFGEDNRENIQHIVQAAGELFKVAGASYNEQVGDVFRVKAHYRMESSPHYYSREGSLCQRVVERDAKDPLMITNLQKTNYKKKDPRVKESNFNLFIGCPIITHDEVKGTLALFFNVERAFSPESLKTLSAFGQILGDELLQLQLSQRMKRSLDRAKNLQKSLFPKELPTIDNLIPATSYWQAHETGGDYFNLHFTGENLFLFMVDVTGHGLDAALITVYVSSFFRREIKNRNTPVSPESFLKKLHYDFIEQGFPDDYSLEAICGLLNLVTMDLSYAAAGSIRSLKIKGDRAIQLLPQSSGSIINNYIQRPVIGSGRIELSPGEALLFYTDGLDEPFLVSDVDRGLKRMMEFSQRLFRLLPFQEMLDRIVCETIEDLGPDDSRDDMAIMGIYHLAKSRERIWEAPKELEMVLPFIDGVLEDLSFIPIDSSLLRMALTEAVNNAIEHAKEKVSVTASWSKDEFFFAVTDDGPGYHWKKEIDEKRDLLNEEEERGRGLLFISLACERFILNQKGNRITMAWSMPPS